MNYLKLHVNPKKADVDLALCRRIIKEIRRHPKGISQQAVLLKVVKGYRGSDNSASYTKESGMWKIWVSLMPIEYRLRSLGAVDLRESAKEL